MPEEENLSFDNNYIIQEMYILVPGSLMREIYKYGDQQRATISKQFQISL